MARMLGRRLFGWLPSRNERLLKRYRRMVGAINALENDIEALDDDALKRRFEDARARLSEGKDEKAVLPEVFALVREAARRTIGLRHFDVQLIGGMVLHDGKISEMQTGEGKTLVATLPACLSAAHGRKVHIITVNDYLAGRDAEWMGPIYRRLGLEVGVIVSGQDGETRAAAYRADVTYGTNNEFGFDYLRDNMVWDVGQRVQSDLNYAIIDEVDSILIDEARTPLIISGPAESDGEGLHERVAKLVKGLERGEDEEGGDYTVDEKSRQAVLTEAGHTRIEDLLAKAGLLRSGESLYDMSNIGLMHHVNAALRACSLFQRNVDYLVKNGEVLIVDEFTGRVMPGRRWSDGLHQAIEAKEGVRVHNENRTMASITFQNYFRHYDKLSGMTGTADTEAYEFQQIYGLEVARVPTHREMVRDDMSDLVYMKGEHKRAAIIADIEACVAAGRPVLVGTTSIESSEQLSKLLKKRGVEHQVLNAKQHESESKIIAQAGRPRTVTIATNMAGRGTDIVLGGAVEGDETDDEWKRRHAEVVAAGGLHIIGTERHESRRIDNQLRGRAGRQGDPGSSRFYLSLEDNLMRIFAGDKMRVVMSKLGGLEEDEAIEHPWVTRAIENAQRKVEAHNFNMRKTLLEYDDTANEQRLEFYSYRDELIRSDSVRGDVRESIADMLTEQVGRFIAPGTVEEQWEVKELEESLERDFGVEAPVGRWLKDNSDLERGEIVERVIAEGERVFNAPPPPAPDGGGEVIEWDLVDKMLTMKILDHHWRDHLAAMDYLRQGIGLRSFAQRNPKQEYKREAFAMFKSMMEQVDRDVARHALLARARKEEPVSRAEPRRGTVFEHASANAVSSSPSEPPPARPGSPGLGGGGETVRKSGMKMQRNAPCPCGSGKKYKHCCGR